MNALRGLVRRHLFTLLLLLLAGGFAVILGELFLYQHWEGTQLVGLIVTIVGTVAVVAGLFVKGTLRSVLAILLLVLSVAGLLGVREHSESAAKAQNEEDAVPPPLAPLGVSGLSLMGFVLLFARRDDESPNQ